MSDKQTQSNVDFSKVLALCETLQKQQEMLAPKLLAALNRDRYYNEIERQLRESQKIAQAWRDWPIIQNIHQAIIEMRNGEIDSKYLLNFLQDILYQSGVTEYGLQGEEVLPEEVEVLDATGTGKVFVVDECKVPGLKVGSLPMRKPKVTIKRIAKEGN